MYEKNKDNADFYIIYTKEAHASDSRRPNEKVIIKNHTTLEERSKAASSCLAGLKISIPTLIDDMKDTVANAYSAHPDRLFIIGADSKVAFSGEKGPHGFDIEAMKKSFEKIVNSPPEK